MAPRESTLVRRQLIVPTGERLGYLEAREMVKERGGLPSNLMHDETLVGSERWVALQNGLRDGERSGYYEAWAREMLVYPEVGGVFAQGRHVVDAGRDIYGRAWRLAAPCIPEAAIGVQKVALVVDPLVIEVTTGMVTVWADPKVVVVISNFIQVSGQMGKLHEQTGVPLELPDVLTRERLGPDQIRWILRGDGPGVRPISRSSGELGSRKTINAVFGHDEPMGVGYVAERAVMDTSLL
ncbi:MAG: hypothetical protein KGH72_04535 [Candidatus Micrarchaeota archaeon]|nr:hypothetical protein [Candidatus Micrarchaeota archaeon]